jgi:hypothetical protein
MTGWTGWTGWTSVGWGALVVALAAGCDVRVPVDGDRAPPELRLTDGTLEVGDLVPGDLVITEILQDPDAVADALGEWFEVLNASGAAVDLGGLVLSDLDIDHHVVDGHPVVPAGGRAVFGRNADPATNGGVAVDVVFRMWLANGTDELILSNEAGVIDEVAWDGGAAFPDPRGAAMAVSEAALQDNDLGGSWCEAVTPFGDGDHGTPGAPNDCGDAGGPWFLDADGDGYGDPATSTEIPSAGWVADGTDCDDSDATAHPGAPEVYGDAVDQDCDGYLRPPAACTGIAVPGDYATIQAALDAIFAGGTSTRICLGERTYVEDLDFGVPRAITVTLAGVNADVTVLRGDIDVSGNADFATGLTLMDLTVEGGVESYNPQLLVQDAVVTGGGRTGIGIYASSLSRIDIVRSDVSSTTSDAVQVFGAPGRTTPVSIRDSYLHDSAVGVQFWAAGSTVSVELRNNTIANNRVGIQGRALWPYSSTTVLTMSDNVVFGSTEYAFELDQRATSNTNTALFGNTTNYAGAASGGTGTITSDPLLDWSVTPPAPGEGSPLVDAASASATTHDFWFQPRAVPDIGAVER